MVSKEDCTLCNHPEDVKLIYENELCEECLDDIYRCEQCGILQACCSDCVL